MKAITLTAPYGTLIAIAERWPNLGKHYETRGPTWRFAHRGPIAIHQGKNLKPVGGMDGLESLCRTEPFQSVLRIATIGGVACLPLGAVVAVAEIEDIFTVGKLGRRMFSTNYPGVSFPLPTGNDRHFGDYSLGRSILKLARIRALPTPVYTRGYQGIWNLPADVEAAVYAQLRAAA